MNDLWLINVFELLHELSDIQIQQDSWFGNTTRVSSYTELMSSLYDDNQFEEFISNEFWNNTSRFSELKKEIIELNELINSFETEGDILILKTPEWIKITVKARQVINIWITLIYKM